MGGRAGLLQIGQRARARQLQRGAFGAARGVGRIDRGGGINAPCVSCC